MAARRSGGRRKSDASGAAQADYSFDDATKYFETEEREIVSGTTDQQGTLQLTTGGLASLEGLSPGMLSGKFTVKVFEKSGDFSVDQQIIPVSPYDESE